MQVERDLLCPRQNMAQFLKAVEGQNTNTLVSGLTGLTRHPFDVRFHLCVKKMHADNVAKH